MTTFAIQLAAATQESGEVPPIIDTDPQATTNQWASWHEDIPPRSSTAPARRQFGLSSPCFQEGDTMSRKPNFTHLRDRTGPVAVPAPVPAEDGQPRRS